MLRYFLIFLILALVFPWVLAKTSLRDQLLGTIVNTDEVSIESSDASFGYVAPLYLSGLKIDSADKSTRISIDHIEADRSWLGILLSRPDLGKFRFEHPKVDIRIPPEKADTESTADATDKTGDATAEVDQEAPDGDQPIANQAGTPEEHAADEPVVLPNLVAEIVDAEVIIRDSETGDSPIDLKHVDVTFRIERENGSSVIRVDPTTIFDHQVLTPELCGQGLQLVAPLFANEVNAEGEFSLRLSELEVTLGRLGDQSHQAVKVAGEIELHRASVGLQDTATQKLFGLISELLGGVLPDKLTIAEGVKVKFKVADGRIEHQGLAMLLPHGDSAVEITSGGTVGLDETLDLQVVIRFPPGKLGNSSLADSLVGEPLVLAVRGTIDEPEVGLAEKVDWVHSVENLIGRGPEDADARKEPGDANLEGALTDLIGGLLGGAEARRSKTTDNNNTEPDGTKTDGAEPGLDKPSLDPPLFPRLRERMRSRREQPQPL